MEPTHLFGPNCGLWQTVLAKHNKTIESLDEDVAILKEWLKTQPHLPDLLDSNSLRNFILLNKFSIEVTKQKIDNYYTLRKKFEEIYGKINPREEFNKRFCKVAYLALSSKLTPEMCRIFYFRMRKEGVADSFEPVDFVKRLLSLQDVRLSEDVMMGDIAVIDLKGLPLSVLPKYTPQLISRSVTFYERVFSIRLRGIYLFNVPSFANTIISLMKKFMKPKLADRVHVVKDADSIKEVLSLDLLPADFGGKGPSMSDLQEILNASYQKHADFYDHMDEFDIDENRRPNKLENNDVFGFYGNFKKLDLD